MDEGRDASILLVDDEDAVRRIVERSLAAVGYQNVAHANCVPAARERLKEQGPFALVILDVRMPGEPGTELLKELAHLAPHTVVIMATATADIETAVYTLKAGAYDYLLKPLIPDAIQLSVARVLRKRLLELEALERQERVERMVEERSRALADTRRALLNALCQVAEFRHSETGEHLRRMPEYCRVLAHDLARNSPYAQFVTNDFIPQLVESAPLHDIGKVGVPDRVLLKPGRLTDEEFEEIKKHTVYGRDICLSVKEQLGPDKSEFIDMAIDITLYHHERWDGNGYPEGLAGPDTPLAGRIVHLVDFYDACRSPRVYRSEPMPYDEVLKMIREGRGSSFDPQITDAFERVLDLFAEVEEAGGKPAS
jgi:putative two-component system response regulator